MSILLFSCKSDAQIGLPESFEFGADVLLNEKISLLEGKNIGIITNKTGVLSNGKLLVDSLLTYGSIKIKAVFSPEHGFNLSAAAGENVPQAELNKKINIFSLYGKTRKPTASMLDGIDMLVFDIQDIGARFYTYISTLYYVIEAAAENNIPLLVLDRPNPLGGLYVDGPILEDTFISFVGITNLPVVHGMTMGELALMFNDIIGKDGKKAEITVVKMKGWNRSDLWSDLGINWVSTSPNIPAFETACVYPATCYLEGTNISEGRGTYSPFTTIGAPFINPVQVKNGLETLCGKDVELSTAEFTPVGIKGMAVNPKFEDEKCQGVKIEIKNYSNFESVKFGVKLLYTLQKLYPRKFEMKDFFNTLWGTDKIKKMISAGKTPDEIFSTWPAGLSTFKQYRKQFLLY